MKKLTETHPNCGLFITATDTEIGKTMVAAGLAAAMQNRLNAAQVDRHKEGTAANGTDTNESQLPEQVELWKPVQSGVPEGDPGADSSRLIRISGLRQELPVSSHTFPDPLAPWLAAERAGKPVDYAKLVREGRTRLTRPAFTVIEGAGGMLVPITSERCMTDLMADLQLPVVIIARPGLGTVNHTVLSVSYARSAGIPVIGVIVNGCRDMKDVHIEENCMMIERFGGVPVLGRLPWLNEPSGSAEGSAEEYEAWRQQWIRAIEEHIDLDALLPSSHLVNH